MYKMEVGHQLSFSQAEVIGLVNSGILTVTLNGAPITEEWIFRNLRPEATDQMHVRSSSGYELKVLKIEEGQWELEVTSKPEWPEE